MTRRARVMAVWVRAIHRMLDSTPESTPERFALRLHRADRIARAFRQLTQPGAVQQMRWDLREDR